MSNTITRKPLELDPYGKEPNEPGSKLDADKPLPALVLGDFANALAAVTAVGTFGAQKYTRSGWLTVPDGRQRYDEARMRHWLLRFRGEEYDKDSGLLHAAHEAWNGLAVLELLLREKAMDAFNSQ